MCWLGVCIVIIFVFVVIIINIILVVVVIITIIIIAVAWELAKVLVIIKDVLVNVKNETTSPAPSKPRYRRRLLRQTRGPGFV